MTKLEQNSAAFVSATSLREERTRLDQALADISACGAGSVSLVHCPRASAERSLVRDLAQRGSSRGWATATVSLSESRLASPDGLVRDILDALVPAGDRRARGFCWLLDCFVEMHGGDSSAHFAAEARRFDASGDLTAICRAYLDSDDPELRGPIRAYSAWCDGDEPPRKYRVHGVRRALTERTAQRALGELTRLISALGHEGLLIILSHGDALADQTDRAREKSYTILRELVDNFDAAGGALSTRIVITGQEPLFEGEKSLRSVAPLAMRLVVPPTVTPAVTPPPHRSWTTLTLPAEKQRRHRKVAQPEARSPGALRNLIRISEGLPPTDRVTTMSVGAERMDRSIHSLFKLVKRSGSFMSVLVGEYGSGKTHLMMHLAERALQDNRPVFWLNLERANLDLGNPARHFSRLLAHSRLPLRGKPDALTLAGRWTRSRRKIAALIAALEKIQRAGNEAAPAARKALAKANSEQASGPAAVGFALESFLAGHDLSERPGSPHHRLDAYRRLLLWFDLLGRLEQIRGPMLLIDEAENLYTSGQPWSSRRTALRSLAFYAGGALPATCVVMAMTPEAFKQMKREARDLLAEAGDMESTLDQENVEHFRRALWRLKPETVRALTRLERRELCDRVLRMHRSARGKLELPDWDALAEESVAAHRSPRTLIRGLVDQLETHWWSGRH